MEKVPKIKPQRFIDFYRNLVELLAKYQLEKHWISKEAAERETVEYLKIEGIIEKENFQKFLCCLVNEKCIEVSSIHLFNGWYRLILVRRRRTLRLWVNGHEEKPVKAAEETIKELSRKFPEIPLEIMCRG